ncbi:lipoyl protein ligase domain-containing protein [Thermocrinis jamiesonii]|uniref:lipoyl protein ligase domain-containing protein n=1 Tax=Thermocrinis jamiesonii TaxID=1302351 RepID=UPI00069216D4|nr:lipoate--protein ligase [Thermocrinis jamiesonii]
MIEVLSGTENMKRDFQNLLKAEEGMGPLFRLYAWKEPTVSVGLFQELREFPVCVVRRPTGGGALLHGWDISFSVADLKERWGKNYKVIYLSFMNSLKKHLEKFGITLEISKYSGAYDGYFCFYHPTFGELTYGGKKIVACAMRGLKRSFLLHGSLFLRFDYDFAQRITGVPKEVLKDRLISFEELGIGQKELLNVLGDFFASLRLRKTSDSL